MYARAYDCQDSTGHTTTTRTHDQDQDQDQHQDQHTSGKERNTSKAGKPTYIGRLPANKKKYKKKLKKFGNKKKGCNFASETNNKQV